ncbi:MAG: methyltransferase domain-containing protein [Oscillospiraceae bacterium]
MNLIIRENVQAHLKELEDWLAQTWEEPLEDMAGFFSARLDSYEEHMSLWKEAYRRFADFMPKGPMRVLDLGCGTGLELDECFLRNPELQVTGVDLCQDMLEKLREKHGDKQLELVCADYFQYDMSRSAWDMVISFESLHHFFPEQKGTLYRRIYTGLREGGTFLLGDYIACTPREEELLQQEYRERRSRSRIPPGQFVHFDIPLTLEHETALLSAAGFENITPLDCIEGAVLLSAEKKPLQ